MTVPETVGGQDPPEQGEPPREQELEEGGDNHQRRQHGRATLGDRRDADRDEGAGGAHGEHVARADPPDAHRLQNRAHAADQDGGEDCPRQVGLRPTGGPNHDGGRYRDTGDAKNGELQAEAGGERDRRSLVRLEANAAGPLGAV